MHIPFRQMPIALLTIDVIIPGIGIKLVLKSPKPFQAFKYTEHACFVTQEVGILCQMSGGCYISQINAIF